MTVAELHRIDLSTPEVSEGTPMGHSEFHVN